MKGSELLINAASGVFLKIIILGERRKSEKSTYSVIQVTANSKTCQLASLETASHGLPGVGEGSSGNYKGTEKALRG